MFTLHDEELNIKFHNIFFIWAEYEKLLGEKNPITENGMCWKAPGELQVFQEITTKYGKVMNINNSLIVGKTTAKLLPISKLSNTRDVYVLDYLTDTDTNKKYSILYQVYESEDIIDDDITNHTDIAYSELDYKLEELTSEGPVFIIGGASIYNYFLERFPLLHGFVSKINPQTVEWKGSKPIDELRGFSEALYNPNLYGYIKDIIYKQTEYFTTYLVKPSPQLMEDIYKTTKLQLNLSGLSQLKTDNIRLAISNYEFPGYISLHIDDDDIYYVSNVYIEVLTRILESPKVFIEAYYKYDEMSRLESQVYYILHNNDDYLFIFKK